MDPISSPSLAVIPVLVGPLQVLVVLLSAIALAIVSALVSLFKPRAILGLLRLLWHLKIQVALAAGAVGGLYCLAGAYWPHALWATPARSGADWCRIRGDLARTGRAAGSRDPRTGGVRWSYREGKAAFFSSPAIVGNRVYVATGERKGLACLPRAADETPAERWFHATNNAVVLPPAAVGTVSGGVDRVFVVDGRQQWSNRVEHLAFPPIGEQGMLIVVTAGLHHLIALDGETGRELWRHPLAAAATTKPVVAADSILVGTTKGCLRRSPVDGSILGNHVPHSGFALLPHCEEAAVLAPRRGHQQFVSLAHLPAENCLRRGSAASAGNSLL